VAVLSASGFVACGGDDDDDVAAADTGGEAGESTGGRGGSTATGGRGGTASGGRGGMATGGTGTDGGEGGEGGGDTGGSSTGGKATIVDPDMYDGQEVFRYDTFGDEQFWTGTLRMHEAIPAALDPTTALTLGLKVDAEALPEGILEEVDLTDPATTVALIELDAVVGIKGTVENGILLSVGITCALCHSDVDDSVMEGIGVRIDGAANRDLDPGAIIALAPGLADNDEAIEVYNSWGPGMYDPRFNQDGINHPVLIPPIYGLADVPYETYTGDGPISYWNAYVGITQMGGIGNFFDPRIDVAVAYDQDMITAKLPSLYEYQVSLEAPAADPAGFDAAAAARGQALFAGAARCSTCHSGPAFSDAGQAWHSPEETGMDPTTAERSATKLYRTTPLRALLVHPPYFHDGSAATLAAVVTHYNTTLTLGLTAEQQADLVQYLNTL
jgi:mono/diheme cytochrome c family protein